MKKILLAVLTLFSTTLFAQDDLLKQLQSQTPAKREPVIATFKGFKIINIETNETTPKGNLDFRVGHLFGNIFPESGGGLKNFYGLDASADIRIGFHYGITPWLTAGIAHIKRNQTFEGIAKLKLLQQKTNGGSPLSIALFGEVTYTVKDPKDYPLEGLEKMPHRLGYCTQLILARKFGSRFSLVVAPTWVHHNIVSPSDSNDVFSIGGGFRLKVTRSSAIVADYFYNISPTNLENHYSPLGIGWEIETGGHVFTIMYTNSIGLAEADFIPNTQDSWKKGGVKLSFSISRMFKLGE
ncbi:MAG: DUF5777 family beta-barrel protein [Bacteroidetes bacterium]|nr:DUF5777 family beta-barrel protein [Bacteroidota bacterium]